MHCVDRQKSLKTDVEVLIKIQNEVINGKINIDANLGLDHFFDDDMDKKKFIPLYDSLKQGKHGKTIILNKMNIEWLTSNSEKMDSSESAMPGDFNPLPVTVTLRDITFVGEINLGYHKRISDLLNDMTNHFISVLNVEYRGMKRTVFINMDAIISIYDDLEIAPLGKQETKATIIDAPIRTSESTRIVSQELIEARKISEANSFVLKRGQ